MVEIYQHLFYMWYILSCSVSFYRLMDTINKINMACYQPNDRHYRLVRNWKLRHNYVWRKHMLITCLLSIYASQVMLVVASL
jgi:hypothetical protein